AGGDNMLALIAQSPPGTYDLVLSDGEFVKLLKEAGYIETMDPNAYNMGDLFDEDRKR
ncbi:MAG TPA: ABC transporter substrate-binding protein, partial [Gammaproteobacteria bacterium]|nr:ABC transporter substrate-binding protein [Gammaproteobacteria bacterium]